MYVPKITSIHLRLSTLLCYKLLFLQTFAMIHFSLMYFDWNTSDLQCISCINYTKKLCCVKTNEVIQVLPCPACFLLVIFVCVCPSCIIWRLELIIFLRLSCVGLFSGLVPCGEMWMYYGPKQALTNLASTLLTVQDSFLCYAVQPPIFTPSSPTLLHSSFLSHTLQPSIITSFSAALLTNSYLDPFFYIPQSPILASSSPTLSLSSWPPSSVTHSQPLILTPSSLNTPHCHIY